MHNKHDSKEYKRKQSDELRQYALNHFKFRHTMKNKIISWVEDIATALFLGFCLYVMAVIGLSL